MTSNQSQAYDLIKSVGYIMNKLSNYKPDFVKACIRCFNKMQKEYDADLANSVALYVCAKEYGYKPRICYGLCNIDNHRFYHFWLELDGIIIDLSSYAIINYYPAFKGLINNINIPYIGDYEHAYPIQYNKFKKDEHWKASSILYIESIVYIDKYIMMAPNGGMLDLIFDCLDRPKHIDEVAKILTKVIGDKFEV